MNYSVETYSKCKEGLIFVSGLVLLSFSKHDCDTKDQICRNFIAKSLMSTRAIFTLWDHKNYQDGWILHRALLDRFFHLYSIGESNNFEKFEEWSFWEQYKALNKLLSDGEFKINAVSNGFVFSQEQKQRAKLFEKNKPSWRRPKAENVAKDLDMTFLYKYGYDYASAHVHPMANDGEQDFYTITNLKPNKEYFSQITLLSNTLLIGSLILQEGINRSTLLWCKALYDYIDLLRLTLDTGEHSYESKLPAIKQLMSEGRLGGRKNQGK